MQVTHWLRALHICCRSTMRSERKEEKKKIKTSTRFQVRLFVNTIGHLNKTSINNNSRNLLQMIHG